MSDQPTDATPTNNDTGESHTPVASGRRRGSRRATRPVASPTEAQVLEQSAQAAEQEHEAEHGGDAAAQDAATAQNPQASGGDTAQDDAAEAEGEQADEDQDDAEADADAGLGESVSDSGGRSAALDVFAELGVDPAQSVSAPLPQYHADLDLQVPERSKSAAGSDPSGSDQSETANDDASDDDGDESPRLAATALLFQAPESGRGRKSRRAGAAAGPPVAPEDSATHDSGSPDSDSGDSGSDNSGSNNSGSNNSGSNNSESGDSGSSRGRGSGRNRGSNSSDSAKNNRRGKNGQSDGSQSGEDEDANASSNSEGAAGSDEDSGDGQGGKRRRRRRGGRGRRRGQGGDSDSQGGKDDSDGQSDSGNENAESRGQGGQNKDAGSDDDGGNDTGSSSDSGSKGSKNSDRSKSDQGKSDQGRGGKDKSSKDKSEDSGEDSDGPDAGDDGSDSSGSRRRRRRRSRGSRGSGESGRDEVTALKGSTRLEAKRQRRREGRDSSRRRSTITEAEFLARRESVKRDMVVREEGGRTQVAVLEDDVLVEHYVARKTQTSMVGNVHLGRVQNVLPSMEAAFIDIGKGRNAVLYAGEVNWDAAGLEGQPRRIEQALSSGDSVLVQVTKDPVGHKGARLTSQITLAGRYLVLVPSGAMTGISRKLPDNERNRLKKLLKEIVPQGQGVIVRTAAEGASETELRRDVERLTKQWADIEKKVARKSVSAPTLLKSEPQLALRVVRDVFNEDFTTLSIAGDEAWKTISEYVEAVAPDLRAKLHHWTGPKDLFGELRVDEQIAKALDRKVWLPSGGSLIIDRTEAMTVVDVNTGKFTGSGGTLEETVTRNNLEAAEEIVRQLRLRDVGGIIVIDFIDMVLEANRDLVLRRLVECLGRDRTRHQVAEVTSLGLVQMTRKRIGQGLVEAFSENCEHCAGRGYTVHTDAPETKGGNKNQRPAEDEQQRAQVRATLATIAAAAANAHSDTDDGSQAQADGDDVAGADSDSKSGEKSGDAESEDTSGEAQSGDTSGEAKSEDASGEAKSGNSKSGGSKSGGSKSGGSKSSGPKSSGSKSGGSKGGRGKGNRAKAGETKPGDSGADEPKSEDVKSEDAMPSDASPVAQAEDQAMDQSTDQADGAVPDQTDNSAADQNSDQEKVPAEVPESSGDQVEAAPAATEQAQSPADS